MLVIPFCMVGFKNLDPGSINSASSGAAIDSAAATASEIIYDDESMNFSLFNLSAP